MADDLVEVCPALSDKLAALLDVRPHLREHKLRVYLTVAFHKRLAESSRNEVPSRLLDDHIGSLDDVVDMCWN